MIGAKSEEHQKSVDIISFDNGELLHLARNLPPWSTAHEDHARRIRARTKEFTSHAGGP
jgi:hypothetical protein